MSVQPVTLTIHGGKLAEQGIMHWGFQTKGEASAFILALEESGDSPSWTIQEGATTWRGGY